MARQNSEAERFNAFDSALRAAAPHLYGWLVDTENVRRFTVKAQDDGTYLAVAAGDGPDGGAVVCFGVGYGAIGAFYAIERTIQGGNWKVDKYRRKESK